MNNVLTSTAGRLSHMRIAIHWSTAMVYVIVTQISFRSYHHRQWAPILMKLIVYLTLMTLASTSLVLQVCKECSMHGSRAPVLALSGLPARPISFLLGGHDAVVPTTLLQVDPIDCRLGGDPIDMATEKVRAPIRVALGLRDPRCT